MFGKLALLLSVELFVLIAAIFLLVYITKQQVSKWFTYSTVAIVITVLILMICSVCCTVCCRHGNKMGKECRFEDGRFNKKMMIRMHGGPEGMMMMRKGSSCDGEEECEMKEECEMMKECEMKNDCCKGKGGKVIKEVIIDTLPKKK